MPVPIFMKFCKRVEFVSYGMLYIILRGWWCDIIVLNVHAPTEDKTDMKDSCEELQCIFDEFHKYYMKILLGDFSAKVGREDIFKPTILNERLREISNDNDNGHLLVERLTIKLTIF
jgi:hypothetical protein